MEVQIYLDGELPPISSEVTFTATYVKDDGELRVVQKSAEVPLRMLLRPCQTESTASVAVTIKSAEPILSFSQIFPGKSAAGELEFRGESHARMRRVIKGTRLPPALAPEIYRLIMRDLWLRTFVQETRPIYCPGRVPTQCLSAPQNDNWASRVNPVRCRCHLQLNFSWLLPSILKFGCGLTLIPSVRLMKLG
jgi:hypothetical protein